MIKRAKQTVATGLLFPEELPIQPFPSLTPALKWAGGKRWLLPHLLPLWQRFADHRLVEPFVGGMSVALALQSKRAYLSDLNEHLINFYRWLQRGLLVEGEFVHEESAFYEARTRFNELVRQDQLHSIEAATLFYYLNRTCFNGLCRFNRKNEFNVPFGRYKTINYTRDFTHYRPQLAAWDIAQHSFEHTPVQDDDFIYVDPPYDTPFTQYAKEDFTWDNQEKLVRWLSAYDGPIVATNQATPRILELYQDAGFQIQTLAAPRRIACTGDRTPAQEILATKNLWFLMERPEAMRLLRELINQDLVDVARQHGVTIFVEGRKNKGWAWHTLERYLGLPLNSSRAPNFGSWELKSTSLMAGRDGRLRIKETVAITMLDPVEILAKEFEESHLFNKLRKTLLVARIHESTLDERSVLHSIAEFDLTDPILFQAIKADYEAIRQVIRAGGTLTGILGKYIQPRTKGTGHGSTSRAFYARKELVAHLLNITPLRFGDADVVEE